MNLKKIIKFKKYFYIKFIILSVILLLITFPTKDINNLQINKLKVCICTIGKLENNYINEFVEYYYKYGVDKIFLYDNNDIDGEYFDNKISYYINNKFVEVLNYRGQKKKQYIIYQKCYENNFKIFDWLIFYDIDEFINLKNYTNIKRFLINKKFDKCQSIYLNWVLHTDNGLLYYDNRTLHKRFTEIKTYNNYCLGKTIIRGNIRKIKINSCHLLDKNIIRCNGFGNIFKSLGIFCIIPDYNNYYIDHYQFKSTEELINKLNKGDCLLGDNNEYKYQKIFTYFYFNEITLDKINLIENRTGLNISKLKMNFTYSTYL